MIILVAYLKQCTQRNSRTVYIWDGDTVAVILEYKNNQLEHIRHWVFNGFQLVAQQDHWCSDDSQPDTQISWQTCYATTDLNGQPLALYTEQGQRIWRRRRTSLWGVRTHRMRHLEKNRLDPGLLFAGQMEDRESGLVYNRFRYYHPESGTYLSPDPLGLLGGENTYGYVDNPMEAVDPLGLATCPIIRQNVLNNIAASQAARNASNFGRTSPAYKTWN